MKLTEFLLALTCLFIPGLQAGQPTTLRKAFKDDFHIGVALNRA